MGWLVIKNKEGQIVEAFGDVPDHALYGESVLKRQQYDFEGNEMGPPYYEVPSLGSTTDMDDPINRKRLGLKE